MARVGTCLPSGINVIDSGASTGVYAVGADEYSGNTNWQVFKSSNGGASFSQVDQFHDDPSAGSGASVVAGDGKGNVYVAGTGWVATVIGTSHGKPVYSNRGHLIVRTSAGGSSGSWSTAKDYLPTGDTQVYATAMGADLAGNVYVTASALPSTGDAHAIILSNTGGSWGISDDFTGRGGQWTYYSGFTVDSGGTLYAGGAYGDAAPPTFVRSMSGPLAPLSTAQTTSPFSSTPITSLSSADSDSSARTLLELLEA